MHLTFCALRCRGPRWAAPHLWALQKRPLDSLLKLKTGTTQQPSCSHSLRFFFSAVAMALAFLASALEGPVRQVQTTLCKQRTGTD